MDRQILSQEELNALLAGAEGTPQLSPLQKDALGEIGNITYGSASTALSELLNKKVVIDTPTVFVSTQKEIKEQHPIPYVIIEVDYRNGLQGSNVLIIKVHDASIIADLMMGRDGINPNENLGQMELSAVGEAMNQMVGSASTSLSTMFAKRVEIDPPRVRVIDFSNGDSFVKDCSFDDQIAVVSFKLQIENLPDSEIMLLIPYKFAVEMADVLIAKTDQPVNQPTVNVGTIAAVEKVAPPPSQSVWNPEPAANGFIQPQAAAAAGVGISSVPQASSIPVSAASQTAVPAGGYNYRQEVQPQVMVQPAQFAPIGISKPGKEPGNIGLILDVPLQVTVELGSTRMRIKEILDLGIGSVIELDKLAGDPVDIYVNGKLIAKGEVVVIDENFGIKVTDIISPLERANTLQ